MMNKSYNPHRIDAEAMADSMHQINKTDNKPPSFSMQQDKVYTISGKEDYKDEHGYPLIEDIYDDNDDEIITLAEDLPHAYAKFTNGKFYIKRDNRGFIYNPHDLYEEERATRKSRGLQRWNFQEVSQRPFKIYLDFLRTKNKARLIQAEREI